MKAGWQLKTLGDYFEITSSKRVFKDEWTNAGVPFYRAREIVRLARDGFVENELFITRERFETYKGKYGVPKSGDILVTAVGTLGICHVVKDSDEFYFKDGNIIWLRKKAPIDSRYVEYAFKSKLLRDQIDDSVGATVGTYTIVKAKGTKIPVPSLDEQQRIVVVLDKAFAGIATASANAQRNLANARELFESYLESIFTDGGEGWEKLTLKEASLTFGRGKSKHRPRNDKKLYGGPYPFIQTGDIRNSDHIIEKHSQTYSEEGLAQSKLWPKGTICITIAANIAETGILGFDSCFPDSVIGMVVDPARTSYKYVEYLLQSLKAILQSKGKGSAQANINLATFEHEKFPFPDIATQNAVAAKLDRLAECVRGMEATYRKKLAVLSDLKQSLLQKAFAGELT